MKTNQWWMLLCVAALAMACNEQVEVPQEFDINRPSGLAYSYVKKSDCCDEAKKGDMITVHLLGRLATDGSTFLDTRAENKPQTLEVRAGLTLKGLDELYDQLRKGDQVVAKIPYNLAYGYNEREGIPSKSDLIYEVEVLDVEPLAKPMQIQPFDTVGMIPDRETLGMLIYRYDTLREEGFQGMAPGSTVSLHYTGFLTNGRSFDSSYKRGKPLTITLGKGGVIPGMEYAINTMALGESATFVIPPELGYGAKGNPPRIPSNATIIFDVTIVNIEAP